MPIVPVSYPVQRQVTDYLDFTGQTNPVQAVDIRARVTGFLTQMPFREGGEVQKGDLLFEIDPRPYQAQLDQAISQVTVNEAALRLAKANYERDKQVAQTVSGGIPQQQLDQDKAMVEEAQARVKAYQASTEVYKLNLEFTKVKAPISGHASRYYLTAGNLVTQDNTLLTTVVSQDPIYAYFDMDEPNYNKILRAVNEKAAPQLQEGKLPVFLGVQGEDGFPHVGTLDFINNQVNPNTGSKAFRALFSNPRVLSGALDTTSAIASIASGSNQLMLDWAAGNLTRKPAGARLLSPGGFCRIRMPIGEVHPALLVIDRAIGSDQGIKYVYVVDKDNKAQYRRVTPGALQEDGLRVVQGIEPSDKVVVGGLQSVRPRMEVRTQEISMPILGPQIDPNAAGADKGRQGDKETKGNGKQKDKQ
jgi:multidrug efflux system membrane fusion protein